MFENFLPIGSVVLLKNAMKKIAIIGYMQIGSSNKNKLYDYIGVMYPIGTVGTESHFLFDHADIQDVIYRGYTNTEFKEMMDAFETEAKNNPEFAEIIKTKYVSDKD